VWSRKTCKPHALAQWRARFAVGHGRRSRTTHTRFRSTSKSGPSGGGAARQESSQAPSGAGALRCAGQQPGANALPDGTAGCLLMSSPAPPDWSCPSSFSEIPSRPRKVSPAFGRVAVDSVGKPKGTSEPRRTDRLRAPMGRHPRLHHSTTAPLSGSIRDRGWVPSIAPSGMAFYSADLFPAWRGNLFIGALAGEMLVRLELEVRRSARKNVSYIS
jgi:hypothetical protein